MHLFISAGEPSGDLHGANLVRALKQQHPNARIAGFGGEWMAAAGAKLLYPLTDLAVMWLGPVEIEIPTTPPRRVKPVGGWSPEADARAQPEVAFVALAMAAATIFFGIVPSPLFHVANDVGHSLAALL